MNMLNIIFQKVRINCNKFVKSTKNEITIKLSEKEKKEKIKLLKIYNSEKGNLDYLHLKRNVIENFIIMIILNRLIWKIIL